MESLNKSPVWLTLGVNGPFKREEEMLISGTVVGLFASFVQIAICLLKSAVFGAENGVGRKKLLNEEPVWLSASVSASVIG